MNNRGIFLFGDSFSEKAEKDSMLAATAEKQPKICAKRLFSALLRWQWSLRMSPIVTLKGRQSPLSPQLVRLQDLQDRRVSKQGDPVVR